MSSLLDVAPGRPATPDLGERWRCAWTDGRERCHYPGSMSPETRGSNRWFCSAHFFCADGAKGQQIIEESRNWQRGVPRERPVIEGSAVHVRTAEPQPELALDQAEPGSNG